MCHPKRNYCIKMELSNVPALSSANVLQYILPDDYIYKHISFEGAEPTEQLFICNFHINLHNQDEVKQWVKKYNQKTKTTMNIRTVYNCNHQKRNINIYKVMMKCHHNTRGREVANGSKSSNKNTRCPTTMMICVKKIQKRSRSKKITDTECPCSVHLNYQHNHPLDGAEVLRFRSVSDEVRLKFIDMFRRGHSPSSALECHKLDLQAKDSLNYISVSSDRYHCPDIGYCVRLYNKHVRKEGIERIEGLIEQLEVKLNELNKETNELIGAVEHENGDVVVALCTPLMRRLHERIEGSAEVVFIDSTGGTADRGNHRVFLFITQSAVGGVPLGAVITNSERQSAVTRGFSVLQSILPTDAFFGQGHQGPKVIVTDDSLTEKRSLNTVFPNSNLVLCTFYVLQAVWKWLWNKENSVLSQDRRELFQYSRDLIYADNILELQEKYNLLLNAETAKKYPRFLNFIEQRWLRKREYTLEEFPHDGVLGKNYHDIARTILKDRILEHTKDFNIVQFTDYVMAKLESYYQGRLLDAVHNDSPHCSSALGFGEGFSLSPNIEEKITKLDDCFYSVPSESEKALPFLVNVDVCCCNCVNGKTGNLCIHQFWVSKKFGLDLHKCSCSICQACLSNRAVLYYCATGKEYEVETTLSQNGDNKNKDTIMELAQEMIDESEQQELLEKWEAFSQRVTDGIKSNSSSFYSVLNDFLENTKVYTSSQELIQSPLFNGRIKRMVQYSDPNILKNSDVRATNVRKRGRPRKRSVSPTAHSTI